MDETDLTPEELQRRYRRNWRQANAERVREYQREWLKKHPGKQKEYTVRYWQKKANEANRAGREPEKT